MRRCGWPAAAVVVLALAAPVVRADDAGPDVFDSGSFDQSVQQSRQQEQKAKLETQFGGNLLYDTSVTTVPALDGYGAAGSFSGKAFVKVTVPDTGALYLAYNFSKNLYQGAAGSVPGTSLGPGGPALSQPAGDLYGASYALAEFYASLDIAHAVFFRIGNQLLAWGPSVIWTPVDFVNLEHVNPLSPLDLRVGKPGIRATVPVGTSTLFLFADLSRTVASPAGGGSSVVNDPAKTAALAGRWDVPVAGAEVAVSGLASAVGQSRAGLDASGRLLGFDVYGELAAALPTATDALTWSTSAGLQRDLGDLKYWHLAGEVYYNGSGTADISSYAGLAASEAFDPFYVGKWYAYVSAGRSHLFVDGVSTTLAAFTDLSDGSFLARVSTSLAVPGVPPLSVALSWAGGGAGKAFTYVTGNNSLTADLQVVVEF
ncbi:MAG TPA: hypothetical protein VFI08_08495 [Spirochaetia bacterium]|nr:hypothetical protein [Spirochaetia bacterium]